MSYEHVWIALAFITFYTRLIRKNKNRYLMVNKNDQQDIRKELFKFRYLVTYIQWFQTAPKS